MMRLSLSSGSSSETSSRTGQTQSTNCENSETWREYFEPDEDGDVQLHLAVAEGLADVVEALIRLAPSTQLLSIQNNQGYSPLHIAVLKNQPAFVRRLVVAGARLELRDGEGHSPLHLAARRGYVECAEALLKPVAVHEVGHGGGLRVHAAVQQIDILDQRNTNGEHSVHLATMGGHVPFLVFLSWNNADMNALEGRAGRSALHLAVGSQRLDLVQCLLEPKPRGCGSNPDILDWYGRTPHQLSMLNGNVEIATYMASHFGYPTSGSSWILEDNPSEIDSDEEINNLGPKLVNSSA
jgi:ankyrin repeat protein